MKKILLLVLFTAGLFTQIMFSQTGKDVCNCGEKAIDISTGYNNASKTLIPNGQPDNEWKIIANPTSPIPNYSTGVNPIVANPGHPAWALATSRAQWLKPPVSIDAKIGEYQYQYIFTVPPGYMAKVKISRIGGDDDVELFVDYSRVYFKTGGFAFSEKFVQQQKCIEIRDLSANSHTITIKVKNTGQGDTGGYLEGCYDLIPCHCPKGWLSNTSNQDGGITTDGRCKKLVCGPIAVIAPPDGTQVGNWGFTWGKELWAYGTKENGGAVICDDKNNENIWDAMSFRRQIGNDCVGYMCGNDPENCSCTTGVCCLKTVVVTPKLYTYLQNFDKLVISGDPVIMQEHFNSDEYNTLFAAIHEKGYGKDLVVGLKTGNLLIKKVNSKNGYSYLIEMKNEIKNSSPICKLTFAEKE